MPIVDLLDDRTIGFRGPTQAVHGVALHWTGRLPTMDVRRIDDDLGLAHSWGAGREVILLSDPLANPVFWSADVRSDLLPLGYQVTTFEHRPQQLDWRTAVTSVDEFIARRPEPVALIG